MAGRNSRTKTEYCGERNEERSETCSNNENNDGTKSTFTVQNYRDYNVYSDVENVLNSNPVSYIDHIVPLKKEENKKTSDTKSDQKSPQKSLIADIDNGRNKTSSISSFIKTASHSIAPTTSLKRSVPVKRIPRKDDSEQNYYDDLALNEHTIGLFGGQKTGKTSSVTICLFNQ